MIHIFIVLLGAIFVVFIVSCVCGAILIATMLSLFIDILIEKIRKWRNDLV
jgi:hypothetical protein